MLKCNSRIVEYDCLEVLSIFFVCSIHYPAFSSNSVISQSWHFISLTAVPIFFAVHGALLLNKGLSLKKHLSRLCKTVSYLLLFKLFVYCFFVVFGYLDPFATVSDFLNYFFTCSTSNGFPVEHTWFIYALISIYLVYPIVALAFQHNQRIVSLVGFLGILTLMCCNALNTVQLALLGTVKYSFLDAISFINPFGIWSFYLCIFMCGPSIFDHFRRFIGIRYVSLAITFLLIGMTLLMYKYCLNYGTYCWSGQVLPDQYIQFGVALEFSGLVMLIFNLSSSFVGDRFASIVQRFSENTLFIFYLHMPVLWLVNYYFDLYLGFLFNLFRSAVVFVSIGLFAIILNNVFDLLNQER